ncbi:MAG: hypothetical protein V1788_01970, partial [Nanoarchaeota archaeon]
TSANFNTLIVKTNDVVTCNASGSTDADTDSITYWYKFNDTEELQDWSPTNTFDCSTPGCDLDDVVTCWAKATTTDANSSAYEGQSFTVILIEPPIPNADVISINPGISTTLAMTSEKYIEGFFFGGDITTSPNTAPVVSSVILNSTSGNNLTSDNLTCYITLTDANANTMNASVRWYRNLTLNRTIEYNNSYSSGTTFISTLLSGNLSIGDVWMCSANAYDGTVWGEWVNSSNLTLGNTPPTVVLVSPADNDFTTNRTPLFTWDGNDDDGDLLTYYLNITCYHTDGGGCSTYGNDNRFISTSQENYVPIDYLKYLQDTSYYYNWTVLASDGFANSSWATPRRINIQGSLDIVLINDTINFGNLTMDESKNTTTNSPYPFSLQNNGNCFANISINATQLWNTMASNSDYYKFKADNISGEEGAFDWLKSLTSWNQMPLTGQSVAIVALNFSDSKNSVEVDLLVTVPNQEPWGDRESTVSFEAKLGE